MRKIRTGLLTVASLLAVLATTGAAIADPDPVDPTTEKLSEAASNGARDGALSAASHGRPLPTPVKEGPKKNLVRLGFGMDLGLPSGAAIGFVANPALDWVRLQVSLTYNYLSFGGRGSVQVDPMALDKDLAIGLFLDLQGGFSPESNIPGQSNLPAVGYDYLNIYGGLRLGKPNGFHWNIEVGPTYMHVSTNDFQTVVANKGAAGLILGNPTVEGWIPSFITGFTTVWDVK